MQIQNNCLLSINCYNNHNQQQRPAFRSYWRTTTEPLYGNRNIVKNATCFFRNDLDWNKFCDFIMKNFKKSNKVHLVSCPCSDGSEPISLLLKLMQYNEFRNNPLKYGKIKGYDIDETQIEIAKSGKIPLLQNPFIGVVDVISLYVNARNEQNKSYTIEKGKLILSDAIKDKLYFEQKDIYEVIRDLPKDEDVVILARNVFPYLDMLNPVHSSMVIEELSKLKRGSVLAIGDYDQKEIPMMEEVLEKHGYNKSEIHNCFVKK